MMYSKEVMRKNLFEASVNLQNAVFDEQKTDKIQKIGDNFHLSPEHTKKLQEIINIILVRLQPVSSFRSMIMSELRISYEQASQIAAEVNARIFAPVMADLTSEKRAAPAAQETQAAHTEDAADPNHLIPTHAVMEKMVGTHNHMVGTLSTGGAAPANLPTGTTAPTTIAPSIVDQKLRGLVRAEREETHIKDDVEKRRKLVYKDADPYREPIE